MKQSNQILGGHSRKKKRIIPPLMELGNLRETSYVTKIIPEIIWIAILNKSYGLQLGTELSLDLVKGVAEVNSNKPAVSFLSSFELLTAEEKVAIKKKLSENKVLHKIKNALENFVAIYFDCPLTFLFDKVDRDKGNIDEVKNLLEILYDIKSPESTFMMGSVVYHFGALGRLSIVKDSILAKLPELNSYPNTPISQMIASFVRATMFAMMNDAFYNSAGKWNKIFWTRGIELQPCLMNGE